MFNAPGYSAAASNPSSRGGSPMMLAATSRWVTAEPVGYVMGLPPGSRLSADHNHHHHQHHHHQQQQQQRAPPPGGGHHVGATDTTQPSSFVLSAGDIRVGGGNSPLPSRPPGAVPVGSHHQTQRHHQQHDLLTDTPSGRPPVTARKHHATHNDSDMVSTPHASTIGRPQQRMLSPVANDVSEGIADRLAGLWTEYVGGGGTRRGNDDDGGVNNAKYNPRGEHEHATLRDEVVASSSSSQWQHSARVTPTQEEWQRPFEDNVASSHPPYQQTYYPQPKKWVYRHVLTPSAQGMPQRDEGRLPPPAMIGVHPSHPTTPFGLRWDTAAAGGGGWGTSARGRSGGDGWTMPGASGSIRDGDEVPMFQSLPNASISGSQHAAAASSTSYMDRRATAGGAPPITFPGGTYAYPPVVSHGAALPAQPIYGSSSRGASVFSSSTTLPSHSASTAATATYSIVLQEAYRVLEERERTQREHVRFLECQGRKGMVAREGLERPYNDYAPTSSPLLPPSLAAATSNRSGGGFSNHDNIHHNMPASYLAVDVVRHPDDDALRHGLIAMKQRMSPAADMMERPAMLMHGSGRWSPVRADRSGSPPWHSYAYERRARVSEEEALNRRELAAAEAEVREAVCSVIQGMQRHADAVAMRHAVHRALLIAIAEEQEARKKIDGLESHIALAIWQLFREATASLVSTIYERVSLVSRVHMTLQREEAKARLDVVDEEIIRRREMLVKIHEAELLLCQQNAKRLSDASKSLQRVFNDETELRFGVLQEEDYVRNDRYSRWAHEKNVLEHLERQRMSTARSTHSKLIGIVEQELHARSEMEDMEQRLAATMRAYFTSITQRHHHLQQSLYERERREAQRQECHRQVVQLEEREDAMRREMSMAWSCVVAALAEWQEEMSLQHELEAQFQRRKASLAKLHQLEEIETSARIAILYAEEAVHTQHMAWARDVVVSIREEKASAVARRMHTLCEQETFTRSRISEEEAQALIVREGAELRCRHLIQLRQCDAAESDARAAIASLWHRTAKAVLDAAYADREAVLDREAQHAFRLQERQTMIDTYQRAETDSRLGLTQVEAGKREALEEQLMRERMWIVTQVDAKRMAMQAALRDVEAQEASSRAEGHAAQASRWDDLLADCETSWRRTVEAVRAAQRARQQQFRTAALTLNRLEEVNREVLQGAAARSLQDLEARQSDLWRRFKEEHAVALVVMEQRQQRSFQEKHIRINQHEASMRSELVDTETDVRRGLMEQFDLRRPLAQSDNPQVVAVLASERKERIDLEDLFTYERWNLADLEAMSRDDVVDGVQPVVHGLRRSSSQQHNGPTRSPRQSEPSSTQSHQHRSPSNVQSTAAPAERTAATMATWFHTVGSAPNDFADFIIEDAIGAAPPRTVTPQPPHPTEWEYEDADPPGVSSPPQPSVPTRVPPLPTSHAREALQMMQQARRSAASSANATPVGSSSSFSVPPHGPGTLPVPDVMRSPPPSSGGGGREGPGTASPTPRRVLTVPSLGARLPPSGGPPVRRAAGNASSNPTTTAVHEHLFAELVVQEADRRKKLAQFQYQLLAQLIQHNIETLPDAS